MFVAASTRCFPGLPLQEVFDKLADLEYTSVEIVVNEEIGPIQPSELAARFDYIVQTCRMSRRISPTSFFYDVDPNHEKYYDYFSQCCQLAKATKIVVISVRPSKSGTPFNAEVERLQRLMKIGTRDGVHVGIVTEIDSLTDDPDTVGSLCKSVKGLSVCLDPSSYIYQHNKLKDYDSLIEHVCHVRLRDTTKDHFQVQIGQGIIEYGRLVIQLNKAGYKRALCVDLAALPGIDPIAELRKMRLLLESLL